MRKYLSRSLRLKADGTRLVIPTGSDRRGISLHDLKHCARWINGQKRKRFGWQTPAQILDPIDAIELSTLTQKAEKTALHHILSALRESTFIHKIV